MKGRRMNVAIDVETTGLVGGVQEIVEMAFIPLTEDLRPHPDFMPFISGVRPERWDKIQPAALKVNGFTIPELEAFPSRMEVIRKLNSWYQDTVWSQGYTNAQPLAHNWAFERSFLVPFFADLDPTSDDPLKPYLHYHARCSMHSAIYYHDTCVARGIGCPFSGFSLNAVCQGLRIERSGNHRAYGDGLDAAAVYRKLAGFGVMPQVGRATT